MASWVILGELCLGGRAAAPAEVCSTPLSPGLRPLQTAHTDRNGREREFPIRNWGGTWRDK